MSRIAGVDVGSNGAISLIDTAEATLRCRSIPVFKIKRTSGRTKTALDEQNFLAIIREFRPDYAFMEQLNAMPEQGVVAMFTFGEIYGGVKMAFAALGIPYLPIPPAEWKRDLKVTADKEQTRQRASQLFPRCTGFWPNKADHDRAESALIALHGALTRGETPGILEPAL